MAEAAADYAAAMTRRLPPEKTSAPLTRLLDTSFCTGAASALAMVDGILVRAAAGELSAIEAAEAVVKLTTDLTAFLDERARGAKNRLQKAGVDTAALWPDQAPPPPEEGGAP